MSPCGEDGEEDIFSGLHDLWDGIDDLDEGQRERAQEILRQSPRVNKRGRCPDDWED